MSTVALVDYGMGNRRSVEKALEHVGARVFRTDDHGAIRAADAVVVPGVGAFPEAMRRLGKAGLDTLIKGARGRRRARARHLPRHAAPVRALRRARGRAGPRPAARRRDAARGAEAAAHRLERGDVPERIEPDPGLGERAAFYHVHSFVCRAADDDVLGRGEYGERFVSIVQRDNVAGVQFHPEKSSRDGLRLLANFLSQ